MFIEQSWFQNRNGRQIFDVDFLKPSSLADFVYLNGTIMATFCLAIQSGGL